jgi:hypothetical protein
MPCMPGCIMNSGPATGWLAGWLADNLPAVSRAAASLGASLWLPPRAARSPPPPIMADGWLPAPAWLLARGLAG